MGTKIIEGVLEVTERGTTENSIIRSGDLATTTQAGLMSTTDKENLDTLVNSFNSDDANTTIDTIKEVLKAFENAPEATNIVNVLADKQDAITDLETIRNGANAGATAVQPNTLATVATSGNYNDLSNLPEPAVTQAVIEGDGILT